LSLALREAELIEECVTKQGIPLRLQAVATFKVGDDSASIANAARRFLAEQDRMEELCGRIFAGHLRSIVGALTVEEIIRERDKVAQEVKDASHAEMENLAAPRAAAVASAARIAAAERDQEAAEKEQQAARAKALYQRETAIVQAEVEAEIQQAEARASQAGPLAEAQAAQDVIAEKTALAADRHASRARRCVRSGDRRRPPDRPERIGRGQRRGDGDRRPGSDDLPGAA
jgi:flotillin